MEPGTPLGVVSGSQQSPAVPAERHAERVDVMSFPRRPEGPAKSGRAWERWPVAAAEFARCYEGPVEFGQGMGFHLRNSGTSFGWTNLAELFRFRQSATDVQGIVCMACSHGNFVDPGEESDAQNRYGPCNRRGDVGFGGDRADGVRRAERTRHERIHPARGANRAESTDARLLWDHRQYGLRTRLGVARRLAWLGLLSLLMTTDWSMPL